MQFNALARSLSMLSIHCYNVACIFVCACVEEEKQKRLAEMMGAAREHEDERAQRLRRQADKEAAEGGWPGWPIVRCVRCLLLSSRCSARTTGPSAGEAGEHRVCSPSNQQRA